ncbi:GntR family transcriptional regulator [Priestia taiwanensis]|uniref:GntR family transcriptional regulator n=1 Tax=Priestia taiwanensis TaxID=1347902 RepID=A0A917AI31_9BACI|nr:GntR family transcriptional regulator [Priestia taiwanensis]MBM7361472.1 GntR family transcriptional regulator [Priestia taiwanensis]GGE54437.1 GntR family transcriptional regulator [Priestia taiwanensis]
MKIHINPRGSVPVWEQIVQQIKEFIIKGVLLPNEKLPSILELSSMIIVNPNTVGKAYQYLERQGIVETIRGRGTFISEKFHPTGNEEQQLEIKKALKKLLIEASCIGVTEELFRTWIEDIMNDLGGESDATSKKPIKKN